MNAVEWETEDAATYTAEVATINGHRVSVCLDDEGPMRPAYYWDIDNRTIDGWAGSVKDAKRDAIVQASDVRTWADGYGVWHASTPIGDRPVQADLAADAIHGELLARYTTRTSRPKRPRLNYHGEVGGRMEWSEL